MMTYDMKGLVKSLTRLNKTEKVAAGKAVKKAATKQRPALLSFDEVEAMSVPNTRSAHIVLSGPTLEETMINDASIEDALNVEAREIVGEMIQSLKVDLKGVLK
jgi:hypothetical protein